MTHPQESSKTNFQRLLDWASRDKVCAMSLCLGIIAVAPHVGTFLLEFLRILLSATAVAAALK